MGQEHIRFRCPSISLSSDESEDSDCSGRQGGTIPRHHAIEVLLDGGCIALILSYFHQTLFYLFYLFYSFLLLFNIVYIKMGAESEPQQTPCELCHVFPDPATPGTPWDVPTICMVWFGMVWYGMAHGYET